MPRAILKRAYGRFWVDITLPSLAIASSTSVFMAPVFVLPSWISWNLSGLQIKQQ
jgi:hypothetical protein